MKKFLKIFLTIVMFGVMSFALLACDSGVEETPSGGTPSTETPSEPSTPSLEKITGVTFSDATYTYEYGVARTIEVSGTLPNGVSVVYENHTGMDANTYNAKATISGEGYETLVLTATLTIEKAEISDVTFSDASVEYDTYTHSIQIVGNLPYGAKVEYTYNDEKVTGVSAVGSYAVVAKLYGDNYVTKELKATLSITSTDEILYSVVVDGTVYFQNFLDSYTLYSSKNGNLTKVNKDEPEYMVTDGSIVYYYSSSLFSKSIKTLSGGVASVLYDVAGEYLTTDGSYIYYAVNNLLFNTDQNGIYRYALDGSDEEPTRISVDKAAYLCYYDGYIYYANVSNHDYLSRISVTSTDGNGTTLWEEKISYLLVDNGVLYFDSFAGVLSGSAIRKYTISSGQCVKLTTDSGKYLTKIGSYVYYINNDLLTSTIFGDGIYKVSALTNSDNSLPGQKVLSTESNVDGYTALAGDEENLYYYKRTDKHFYQYTVSTGVETDLMENYTPSVEQSTYAGAAITAVYKGEVYYTDPTDGNMYGACLYKYNPVSKQSVKVLAGNVSGVWFNGDYMYYSTSMLTNYALYRLNMTTGESEKLNSKRCEHLIFEGDYVYYLEISAGKDKIVQMKADGSESVELYADENISANSFVKIGNDFYYMGKGTLGYIKNLSKFSMETNEATVVLSIKMELFEIVGSTVYYYDADSSAIKTCSLKGENVTTIVSGVDVNDFCVLNGEVYYSTNGSKVGLYKGTEKISENVAHGFVLLDGNLYFIQTDVNFYSSIVALDYPVHEKSSSGAYVGDGKLYVYDGKNVVKVA